MTDLHSRANGRDWQEKRIVFDSRQVWRDDPLTISGQSCYTIWNRG